MTSSWFFLSTLNYDARSTTHHIYVTVFTIRFVFANKVFWQHIMLCRNVLWSSGYLYVYIYIYYYFIYIFSLTICIHQKLSLYTCSHSSHTHIYAWVSPVVSFPSVSSARVYSINIFFSIIHYFYEIMLKNIVQPGRPPLTKWRVRFPGWVPKVTNTNSE